MSFADLQSAINSLFGDFAGTQGGGGRRRGRGQRGGGGGGMYDPFGVGFMDTLGWDDSMWGFDTPMLLSSGVTGGGGVGKQADESKMSDEQGASAGGQALQTQQGGALQQAGGQLQLPLLRCRVNVEDTDKLYKVTAEVPGFDKENLKVNISDDNILTITGEQKKEHIEEAKDKKYLRTERVFGRVQRSLRLPQNIEKNKVGANYLNGVLHIDVPKIEQKQPASVPIA